MEFDIAISRALNSIVGISYWSDLLLFFIADYLEYFLILGVFAYWLLERKSNKNAHRNLLLFVFSVVLSRGMITEIIRYFWYRERPFFTIPDLWIVVPQLALPSFPSGHAAMYFAIAFVMYHLNKRIGSWYFVFAALISLSRVVLGFHYLTDIVAGFLVAWFSVAVIKKIFTYRLE